MRRAALYLFILLSVIAITSATSEQVVKPANHLKKAEIDKQKDKAAISNEKPQIIQRGMPVSTKGKPIDDKPKEKEGKETKGKQTWFSGFTKTLLMIISMEIGDKTFFIGAILAMSHNKWLVFIGSVSALVLMCVISCILGLSAPILMSREVTVVIAAVLFVFFGVKMLIEGIRNTENSVQGEYEEAEESIKQHIDQHNGASDSESGLLRNEYKDDMSCNLNNIILRTFVMVFFAEWGDRSQFSTIILAGTHPVTSVIAGATCGYIIATMCGILGGHFFARVISPRIVSIAGGILFILFALQILIMKD